jgi:host factor-I protein
MASNFDTALPSIRQVQSLVKSQIVVELKLMTGDVLTGRLGWQDANCVCLIDESDRNTTIWRQAIAYLRPRVREVREEE